MKPSWYVLASFILLLLLAKPLAAEPAPEILSGVRIEQQLDAQVPGELEFRDETGKTVRLSDYFGKPVILVLAYYRCPKLCTLVLNGLREALQPMDFDIGKQFNVVTVSFNPSETPELAAQKKQSYIESYGRPGAAEGWRFLTGAQGPIERLTKCVGFHYVYDPKTDQFAHASAIIFLTPEGKVSKYLYGVKYVPRDVRLALVEASENKIGTPVDQVLLYCFHYDPERGKYTTNVLFFLRVGGVATVALLAVFGLVLWRHERRKPRRPAAGDAPSPLSQEDDTTKPG